MGSIRIGTVYGMGCMRMASAPARPAWLLASSRLVVGYGAC